MEEVNSDSPGVACCSCWFRFSTMMTAEPPRFRRARGLSKSSHVSAEKFLKNVDHVGMLVKFLNCKMLQVVKVGNFGLIPADFRRF